jgi:hypothetical protein
LLSLALAACVLGGCASYNSQTSALVSDWEAGNYAAAAGKVEKEAAKHAKSEKDGLVWSLECGAIMRGAGEFNQSVDSLVVAEEMVQSAESAAKTQVSNEAIALATNLTQLPYKGYFYDRIMLNTYQALNYMVLGDLDATRVELNRASQRQRDALGENSKRIEAAEEDAKKAEEVQLADGSSYVGKAKEDDTFNSNIDTVYQEDDGVALYADYVNPFSVFIDGLFFLANPYSGSDLERARKSFQRVSQMAGSNQYLKEDLNLANSAAVGAPVNNLTYVVLETGSAPYRKEIRIDIPVFLVSGDVPYVGAAFPRLAYNDNYLSSLEVNVDATIFQTERICSMDSVVKTEFYNELPIVITKTLVAAGTKALAAYAIKEAMDDSIIAKIATSAYQLAMNKADLRTWRSLPKEFQYCRFATPDNGQITIRNPLSGESQSITVESNNVNVVYVRATGSTAPMSVHQFTMRPSRDGASVAQDAVVSLVASDAN